MRWKRILFLALGHVASDFYPGMLSPLLPLFTEQYGWTLAQAGTLVMVMNFTANALQPVFGILNDNHPKQWFLWAGPIVSAVPFCFLLMIPDHPLMPIEHLLPAFLAPYALSFSRFHLMLVLLAIAGTGVSMFHPVGAVAAGHVSDENRRGISMALFSSGGSVGVTVAPLALVFIVSVLGKSYMPLVAVPAIIMGAYFLFDRSIEVSEHSGQNFSQMYYNLLEYRRELFLLWLVSSFRAIVYTGLSAFLPMLVIARGSSYAGGAYSLAGALFAGMLGIFIGGHFSDLYGRRKIMAISQFAAAPCLLAFLYTSGPFSMVLLFLGSLILASAIPVNVVLAQEAAPKLAGIASSLVMGVAFMIGGLAAPPFGILADRIGIEAAMNVMFAMPILGGITVFFLKKS